MADYTYTGLEVVARHVPDPSGGPFESMGQAQAAGHDTLNPVSGMFEVGVVIEGAFVPLLVEKASLVYDAIQLAAASQPQTQPAAPQPQAEPQAEPQATSDMQTGQQPTTGPLSDQGDPQPQG